MLIWMLALVAALDLFASLFVRPASPESGAAIAAVIMFTLLMGVICGFILGGDSKMIQDELMKFDPATGEEKPYPSHAAQWRKCHGKMTAWLFNPWTGTRRDAGDVGSDPFGLLIAAAQGHTTDGIPISKYVQIDAATLSRTCEGCGTELHGFDEAFEHSCPEEKVIVTPDKIYLYGFARPTTGGEGHSCRTAANEACAWAIKRLGEELEKSVGFIRTGEPTDNVVICN